MSIKNVQDFRTNSKKKKILFPKVCENIPEIAKTSNINESEGRSRTEKQYSETFQTIIDCCKSLDHLQQLLNDNYNFRISRSVLTQGYCSSKTTVLNAKDTVGQ